MGKYWYALHSHPHKEDLLWKQIEAHNIEVFYPRVRVSPVNPRSRKIRPYFPGYLFVQADLDEVGLSVFSWMPYATGLVSFGGEPSIVSDALINTLKQRIMEIEELGGELFDGLQPGELGHHRKRAVCRIRSDFRSALTGHRASAGAFENAQRPQCSVRAALRTNPQKTQAIKSFNHQGTFMAEYRKTIPAVNITNQTRQDRFPQAFVLLYLLSAVALFVAVPFLAGTWPSLAARAAFLVIPYLTGLVFLGGGLWAFISQRHQPGVRSLAVLLASIAVAIVLLFDLSDPLRMSGAWVLAWALIGATAVDMALRFPKDDPALYRYPPLRWAVFAFAFVLGLSSLARAGQIGAQNLSQFGLMYAFAGLALVFCFVWLALRRMKDAAPEETEQLRLVVLGGLVSFAPLAAWALIWLLYAALLPFSPYLLMPLILFPLSAVYAIQRYRVVNIDFALSRVALYSLIAVLISAGYALLVSGLGVILNSWITVDLPILVGIAVFLVALAFNPLRSFLENQVDVLFFRSERAYQDRLQALSRELTMVVDMPGIIQTIREAVYNAALPARLHIYIYDNLSEQYAATVDANGQPSSDLRFAASSTLVQALQKRRSSLFLADINSLPLDLQPEQSRLALLGAQLFVPLPGRQHLAGWIALGQQMSGEPYSAREINFLESLGDQAAMAIERSQVLVNMENRVREMNVLTRVAQGINITLTLDDILELIYAQTSQVIPSDDFHIMLFDQPAGSLEYLFYIQDSERVTNLENQPQTGASLEQELSRQHRAILTDDYAQECRRRSLPVQPGLYAWMGVPLNAGAEIIGAMSLGVRDSATAYTKEQMNLLQAIADLVAGALVKARLLQETERRARQLSSLNEVTRQLTTTLELSPLLQNILQSAVDILECEAGSLLLVDEQTRELVFQATVGLSAGDLAGQTLPQGTGSVGQAVESRQVIVDNHVAEPPDWYCQGGSSEEVMVRSLLTIPLQAKEKVIGVIEVVDKRDGSPFGRDDQDLLSAFAGQAAVAIENARLYMLTDQALAARVEELSVMQRIDRELNASLDTSRAMRITLEWAMRQSGAEAGLVGVVSEEGIQVMAFQGYTSEMQPFENDYMPLDKFRLEEVVEKGEPQHLTYGEDDGRLLKDARGRMVIPIRRETSTMGLVLLESPTEEPCSQDALNFLMRLSDHAAIAISNAQLYNAVQKANVAKSEFVSFVSHELKNPMTSIKGYTELLAAGAVGPVTDAQGNFLATIKSNVERMSTLVSDLADVSRIEAGRLRLDFKAFPIQEVEEEVSRSLRRQIEDKKQQLDVQLEAGLPNIWADRMRVVQIITNLVSNAYKYTPIGGRILIAAEAIDNQWDPEGARKVVHFWVQDNGIGISEEDQSKIFQKFFRSEDPKTREVTGTGLGLNITRSLVEMQGGRIWFESKFREGTTFHFTVPVAE